MGFVRKSCLDKGIGNGALRKSAKKRQEAPRSAIERACPIASIAVRLSRLDRSPGRRARPPGMSQFSPRKIYLLGKNQQAVER
jgi:hypothetical protein